MCVHIQLDYLDTNCERLEANIHQKRKNLDDITMIMQVKARERQAQQAAVAK
jgi:hypothetical protein